MEVESKRYWNSPPKIPDELVGCYSMGGGGIIEAFYRHFFELKHFQKYVPLTKASQVLELGCGNGRWICSLAPLVGHYTGVDFSSRSLEVAGKCVARGNLSNVELHAQPLSSFIPERKYDVVYFSGVSQYLSNEELRQVLANLHDSLKPATVIVDRSTVNYRQREEIVREGYVSVYRTPDELRKTFSETGFRCYQTLRSYRFLRGTSLLRKVRGQRLLSSLLQKCSPVSLHGMHGFSWLADKVYPVPFEGGDRSHDFFFFER